MCWLLGLAGSVIVVRWLYKDQKLKDELFDPLFFYSFIGILAGAQQDGGRQHGGNQWCRMFDM